MTTGLGHHEDIPYTGLTADFRNGKLNMLGLAARCGGHSVALGGICRFALDPILDLMAFLRSPGDRISLEGWIVDVAYFLILESMLSLFFHKKSAHQFTMYRAAG